MYFVGQGLFLLHFLNSLFSIWTEAFFFLENGKFKVFLRVLSFHQLAELSQKSQISF